jgi:hypothetical protein
VSSKFAIRPYVYHHRPAFLCPSNADPGPRQIAEILAAESREHQTQETQGSRNSSHLLYSSTQLPALQHLENIDAEGTGFPSTSSGMEAMAAVERIMLRGGKRRYLLGRLLLTPPHGRFLEFRWRSQQDQFVGHGERYHSSNSKLSTFALHSILHRNFSLLYTLSTIWSTWRSRLQNNRTFLTQ